MIAALRRAAGARLVAAVVAASAGGCTGSITATGDGGPADAVAAPDATPLPPAPCQIAIDCAGQAVPDEPKIDCTIEIRPAAGAAPVVAGPVGIERRGRSSQSFAKPQYSIELRDAAGADAPVGLFGMGREADWVLNGMYIDRALIRNKLLYELFQAFGGAERWAPESRYCELELDGDFRGLYLLTERVERDDDRVAIAGDGGVGASFIVKQDDAGGFRPVGFANGNWQLVYPDAELATEAQIAGVSDALAGWQTAVEAGGDVIFTKVDLDSAVDYVLLQELARNNDAYYLSVHVARDVDGKIRFVPWDLDLSFGQPLYNDSTLTTGWIAYRPAMIQRMAEVPAFASRLAARWAELRQALVTPEAIAARIDFLYDTIGDRVAANFERWPIEDIQFLDDQLPVVASHAEELAKTTAWIPERLLWMDANIGAYAAGN